MRKFVFMLSMFILIIGNSVSQAQNIQDPATFLGYELGTHFTFHHRAIDYIEHIAEQSDKVTFQQIGQTYEGRTLGLIYVTSTANQSSIEDIRRNNLKRAKLEDGSSDPDAPVIVWLSYNVHGNEAVSTEAALKTLYHLATTTNPDELRWLNNVVVIMDPCLNPDGRDRYVTWYKQNKGAQFNTDPNAREHQFQWATGRTNHYYFDMNRDWAWQSQVETRARISNYNKWMPQIHVDFHEQGYNSPYYFAPAAEPYHEAITPFQRSFQYEIGKNHSKYFDKNGWLFFTRQSFDLLYPSYGDTWPTFNGAIGMTYEQAGIRAGLGIETNTGKVLTLKDRIDHHFTTGLSTIEAAANNKSALAKEFENYYSKATSKPDGSYNSYVLKSSNKQNLETLVEYLSTQNIELDFVQTGKVVSGYNYFENDDERYKTQSGDILIRSNQAKSNLIRVLFDPNPVLSDSVTYDITSWALPWVYGVETIATNQKLKGNSYSKDSFSQNVNKNATAFIFNWDSFKDAQFLSAILQKGIQVRSTEKPQTIAGKLYNEGSIIIISSDQEDPSFATTLFELANEYEQNLTAIESGFIDGGVDLGSYDIHFMKAPKVAIISGEGTSVYTVGEYWHYFDQQLKYPASLVDSKTLGRADISKYDVIILPNGRFDGILSERTIQKLSNWVSEGGYLISVGSSNQWLSGKTSLSSLTLVKTDESKDEKKETKLSNYSNREREYISNQSPGAFFKLKIDATHPLGYGYQDGFFNLKLQRTAFEGLKNGWTVATADKEDHLSGFVGANLKSKLNASMVFGVENKGSGGIIYMTENPLFRAFLFHSKLIVANALFQVGQTRN